MIERKTIPILTHVDVQNIFAPKEFQKEVFKSQPFVSGENINTKQSMLASLADYKTYDNLKKLIEHIKQINGMIIGTTHAHDLNSNTTKNIVSLKDILNMHGRNKNYFNDYSNPLIERLNNNGLAFFGDILWKDLISQNYDHRDILHFLPYSTKGNKYNQGIYDKFLNKKYEIAKYSPEKFIKDLQRGIEILFTKGGFSMGSNPYAENYILELVKHLKSINLEPVFYVSGLTSEKCVIETAKFLKNLGLNVVIVGDATAPLTIQGYKTMLEEAKKAEILVIPTNDVLSRHT